MLYRFLGAVSKIEGVAELDSLGQKIDLKPDVALTAIKGRCLLIPDAEYQKLGITAEEEKKFRYPASRTNAPAELKAKIAKGVAVWQRTVDEEAIGIPQEVVDAISVKPTPTLEGIIPGQPNTAAREHVIALANELYEKEGR